MQNYKLRQTNDTFKNIGLIFLVPALCGLLVLVTLIDVQVEDHFRFPVLILGAIIFFVIIKLIIAFFTKTGTVYSFNIKNDGIQIVNNKNKSARNFQFTDIAMIHVEYMNGKATGMAIISDKGKTIFASAMDLQIVNILNTLTRKMNVITKLVYSKRIRGGVNDRYFYINSLHQDSRLVKRKLREGGFYRPVLYIVLFFLIYGIAGAIYTYFFVR